MQNPRPSLMRVISEDYASLLSVLFPVIFWVYTIYALYSQDDTAQIFVILSVAVTATAIPFFIWRYRSIASVFEEGLTAPGTVTGIHFFRGRGTVRYVYTFQGQKYSGSNTINKTKHSKKLADGQQVVLFIDRNNPKRAFVKEIYL